MKVHRQLGNGFPEIVYQRAFSIELTNQHISHSLEHQKTIYYNEMVVGQSRLDVLIGNMIMVELKAGINLEDNHLAQAINYCHAFKLEGGLLINFGSPSLQFKRTYNKRKN